MIRQPSLTIIGHSGHTGAYILRVSVREEIALKFGRFKGGKHIRLPAGDYVYTGSAMGQGATSLARRLIRHATRSGDQAAHPVRAIMLEAFMAAGLGRSPLRPPRTKTLRWHIDYLLDHPQVNLSQVVVIRTAKRLEGSLARMLAQHPSSQIIERGLGASDMPGNTHLLWFEGEDTWAAFIDAVLTLAG